MKLKNFRVIEPGEPDKIIFDHIFAEKVGGGLVKNSTFDLYPGLAVDAAGNVIKAYKVVEDAASDATSIKIAKGSGIASGDVIGTGKKSVASTAVDTTTSDSYDTVTVSLGVAVTAGTILYQSLSASASAAKPKYTPAFILGSFVPANSGEVLVKLVNGANVRKETILASDEVLELLPGITAI